MKATVRNYTIGGDPCVEGIAELVTHAGPSRDGTPNAYRWMVRFDGDGLVERQICAEDVI